MNAFDAEVREGSREIFLEIATLATVTTPGVAPAPGRHAVIDRNAAVTDDYGVVLEHRCEISLLTEEVGQAGRGTLVETTAPIERWQLLEPVMDDGFETRWTAAKA